MIAEKELAEYRSLCSTLDALQERFIKKKHELIVLLGETAAKKREAFLTLARANHFTRHLTGGQRQAAGITYRLCEIRARIKQIRPPVFENNEITEAGIALADCGSTRQLKQMVLGIISFIDRIKKQLFQLDLLELRCRELISSLNKSLEAFRHESGIIRRKIYPFGVFSIIRRSVRSLSGSPYFSYRDMDHVSALGNITGLVLKIADSPLI